MNKENLKWIKFENGNLSGLSIFSTEDYVACYAEGNTDYEMISDIANNKIENKVIFDVGTFIGLSSLVFARYVGSKGKVIAFEPNPYNRERIMKNYEKNKDLAKKITLYPYALSNKNGECNMLLSKVIEGPSSTSRIDDSHAKIHNEKLPDLFEEQVVETRKLDDFIKEVNIIPDIIKVDIEGAEHLMLAGAINTLEKYHPILYIEIHSEFCAIKCYEILQKYNYKVLILKEEEDNRIMIKALYNESSDLETKYNPNEIYYNLDFAGSQINSKLDLLNRQLEKNDTQNDINSMLLKENQNLKQMLENINCALNNIYASRSWKITKPLRIFNKNKGTR